MSHHRCTGCKQESYPRHKYQGGVYCDDCIKWIRGFRPSGGFFFSIRSFWDRVTDWFSSHWFQPKEKRPDREIVERARHHQLKQMETQARRNIPADPQSGAPQKR